MTLQVISWDSFCWIPVLEPRRSTGTWKMIPLQGISGCSPQKKDVCFLWCHSPRCPRRCWPPMDLHGAQLSMAVSFKRYQKTSKKDMSGRGVMRLHLSSEWIAMRRTSWKGLWIYEFIRDSCQKTMRRSDKFCQARVLSSKARAPYMVLMEATLGHVEPSTFVAAVTRCMRVFAATSAGGR